MKKFFLDTSIQAVRLFYLEDDKKKVDQVFGNDKNYELYISKYSWFEFYHTWIYDLYSIMLASYGSKDLRELFVNLGISHTSRNRALMVLANLVSGQGNDTTKEISIRAFRMLKYELKIAFYNYNDKEIKEEKDNLNCTILNTINQQFNVFQEKGVPKVRFPDFDSCSIKRAKCNIVSYVNNLQKELKISIDAMEKANPKRDEKFRKKGKEILANTNKAMGSSCASISDWLMITEAPSGSIIVTTDEDWKIISESMGKTCIKIPISPLYDKRVIKKGMMDEQQRVYT